MPDRLACPSCEVLVTDDLNVRCWCCSGPMIPATEFRNPNTAPYRNPVLAALAREAE